MISRINLIAMIKKRNPVIRKILKITVQTIIEIPKLKINYAIQRPNLQNHWLRNGSPQTSWKWFYSCFAYLKGIRECFTFQEVIYQRALAIEMELQGINFQREFGMPLHYKGQNIGTRRVDFFVEKCIMVEIKALVNLEDVHLAQAMNYVEAYNLEIGLLINFGAKSLQHKRVHNNKILKSGNHDN